MQASWSEQEPEGDRPDPEPDPPLMLHVVGRRHPPSGEHVAQAYMYREDSVLMLRKSLCSAAGVGHLCALFRTLEHTPIPQHLTMEDAGLDNHSEVLVDEPSEVSLVSTGSDLDLRVWDAHSGGCLDRLERAHEEPVLALAVADTGTMIATVSEDRLGKVWSVADRACLTTLEGHSDWVNAVAFAQGGSEKVVTASMDCCAKVWDLHGGRCLATLNGRVSPVLSAEFAPCGPCGGGEGAVLVCGAPTAQDAQLFDLRTGAVGAVFAGAAPGTGDGGHEDNVLVARASPDGLAVLTGSVDKTARVWDVRAGRVRDRLMGHSGAVSCAAFAPDGRAAATGSHDRTLRCWNLRDLTDGSTQTLEGHRGSVTHLAFAPDGSVVASGGRDKAVRVWDAKSGQCTQELLGHSGRVNAVGFMPF